MYTTFTSLVKGVAFLIHAARAHTPSNQNSKCRRWHRRDLTRTAHEMAQAEDVILKAAQRAAFAKELSASKVVNKDSPLKMLSPTLENDVICVGGRRNHSHLKPAEKNPVILPKRSHFSLLLMQHYRRPVKHQSRHQTEGAVRAAGLWITSSRRLIKLLKVKILDVLSM